ncbi:MAG: glycoside hydrolase family 25 protein [Lachnospiraceae bacterium]|nr:glycoside hydrolase family 25 protein [Lachnospiraceae bacterium]
MEEIRNDDLLNNNQEGTNKPEDTVMKPEAVKSEATAPAVTVQAMPAEKPVTESRVQNGSEQVEEILSQYKRLRRSLRSRSVMNIFLLLLLICAAGAIAYLLSREQTPANVPGPEATPVAKNRFLDTEAEAHAEQYSNDYCRITVEQLLGWQYICLNYDCGFRICVRNEIPREQTKPEQAFSVVLMRGENISECRNPVSIDNVWEIAAIKPTYGEIPYLTFVGTDNTYGFINMITLEEVVAYNPVLSAEECFELREISPEYVAVKNSGTEYNFHSLTRKVSFPGMQLSNDGPVITISTPVALADNENIGYLDATIVPDGERYKLSSQKFGAYVGMEYEDPESTRLIEPSKVVIDNPIVLSGSPSGRYYLPRYEKVPLHTYNWDNLVFEENGFRTLYDEDGNRISKMGIDVSKYNKTIDWKRVKGAGIEFAIVRVGFRGISEGTLEEDPYARENILGATEAGLDVGVYFYTQAITEAEARAEANFVIDHLKAYGADISLPIIIDTELYESKKTARGNNLSRVQRTKNLLAFCKTVEEAGYQPMVYASTRWSIMNYDRDALSEYPFWFAFYGDKVSYRFDFDIWQYTSTGKVPGIEGDVDLNIMLDNPSGK